MLDDVNVLKQRDAKGLLEDAAALCQQVSYQAVIEDGEHDGRHITHVVVAGIDVPALAGDLVKTMLGDQLTVPYEVVREHTLPASVSSTTLVVVCSYKNDSDQARACLEQALAHQQCPQVALITAEKELLERAATHHVARVALSPEGRAQLNVIVIARSLLRILVQFGVVPVSTYDALERTKAFLAHESDQWSKETVIQHNYAKQLALMAVGKTLVFYAPETFGFVAHAWKNAWNKTAKNIAFWNTFPEAAYGELLGWTSHPIEKPFAIFDLRSSLESTQATRGFDATDKLLSGRRPKSTAVYLPGETLMEQVVAGYVLAQFVSIYVAILNNANPSDDTLIERYQKEIQGN